MPEAIHAHPRESLIIILLTMILGGVFSAAAVSLGYIDSSTLGKYLLWSIMGVAAILLFISPRTNTQHDNIIAGYLFTFSIGGAFATYLIDHGSIAGYLLLGGLGLMGVILFIMWMGNVGTIIKGT